MLKPISTMLLVLLPNCLFASEYDDRLARLQKFVEQNQLGRFSEDYWFEMYNSFGEWEPVMLVFGYGDDQLACRRLVELAESDSPGRRFRCRPAN